MLTFTGEAAEMLLIALSGVEWKVTETNTSVLSICTTWRKIRILDQQSNSYACLFTVSQWF